MWKNQFRSRKVQNFLMFLVIMFCTLLLTASFGILNNLEKPFDVFIRQCDSAEMLVYPYDQNTIDDMAEEFKKLNETSEVRYLTRHYMNEEMESKGQKIDVFTNLVIDHGAISQHCVYLQGSAEDAKNLSSEECVLPACISNKYKLQIGDDFLIHFPEQTKTYRIAAIYSDPYSSSTSFGSNILVTSIPESVTTEENLAIYASQGSNGQKIQDAYREAHDGEFPGRLNTVADMKEDNMMIGRIIGSVFLAIGVIMLLVSCLIINFMVRSLMLTDAKTIAVYKTIGYTSKEILMMYLKFFFSIVSTASLIGILGSSWITKTVLNIVYSNIGKTAKANILTAGVPCFLGVSLLVMAIVVSIMKKSKRIKPVMAIAGEGSANTKKHKLRKGSSIGFSSFGIAIRTMRSDKKGVAGILVIAIMTIMSINFGMISLDVAFKLKDHNDYWLGIDKSDVMITINNSQDYQTVIDQMNNDPDVLYYLPYQMGYVMESEWKKGVSSTVIYSFVYDDYEKNGLPVIEGRNPVADDEVAITTVIAKDYGKEVGDYLEVSLGQGKHVKLLITGLYQTYLNLGHSCRVTKNMVENNGGTVNCDTISIYLKDGVDQNSYLESLKDRIGNLGNVCLRTEAMSSIMDMIVTPQKKAVPLMMALVFLIGGINIFSVIMLRNAKCERENGIYKSIGYTSGHLIHANAIYVMILAGISMVIAIPLNLLTYEPIMTTALSILGFRQYPVTVQPMHLVMVNLIVFLVFYLFTIVSSLSIKRVEVRQLVAE